MSSHHFVYIPLVLLFGTFFGFMLATLKQEQSGTNPPSRTRLSLLATAVSVFVLTLLLTHVLPIPGGVKALHMDLNQQQLFDQKASFSPDEVNQRIESFGEPGRESYKLFTYTSDLVFPLSLLFFLLVFSRFSEDRAAIGKITRATMRRMPLLWFATDMIENGVIYVLLAAYPTEHPLLAGLLGYVTVSKFGLLLGSLAVPTVVYIASRTGASPQRSRSIQEELL
jgi:hypothetical protein